MLINVLSLDIDHALLDGNGELLRESEFFPLVSFFSLFLFLLVVRSVESDDLHGHTSEVTFGDQKGSKGTEAGSATRQSLIISGMSSRLSFMHEETKE